jgi:hypothetical protein
LARGRFIENCSKGVREVYRRSGGRRGDLKQQKIIRISMEMGMKIISYRQVYSYTRE